MSLYIKRLAPILLLGSLILAADGSAPEAIRGRDVIQLSLSKGGNRQFTNADWNKLYTNNKLQRKRSHKRRRRVRPPKEEGR